MSNEPKIPPEDDYQQWIDSLLTSSEAQTATPATLPERIETKIRLHRRRSLTWKSTAALTVAASIALVAFVQQQSVPVNDNHQVVSVPISSDSDDGEVASDSSAVKATFVARSDLLAVPIESGDPQVTIIQVYPTTLTQRRRQRQATLQAISAQLDSIKQFSTNGG